MQWLRFSEWLGKSPWDETDIPGLIFHKPHDLLTHDWVSIFTSPGQLRGDSKPHSFQKTKQFMPLKQASCLAFIVFGVTSRPVVGIARVGGLSCIGRQAGRELKQTRGVACMSECPETSTIDRCTKKR
jgi:hypothetical protein